MFDTTGGGTVTFTVPRLWARDPDEALDTWRAAEELVRARWQGFLVAEAATRRGAFAAYTAALDAEEAAATALAGFQLRAAG